MQTPRPTPSSKFFVQTAEPLHGTVRQTVRPVIPERSQTSLGRDAALPVDTAAPMGARMPWHAVYNAWATRITAEELVDVQIAYYRTPTATAPHGLFLRETDGAFCRKGGADGAQAYHPRAWAQLVSLLLQECPSKPRGAAEPYRWLGPATRAEVFAHLVERSERKEGPGHEILLRSHIDPRSGLRALRAVVSGRHSGIHFDDASLMKALDGWIDPSAGASCWRGVDETVGHAILDTAGDCRAVLHWRNSETGAASLSFGAGCYITTLDAVVRDGQVQRNVDTEEVLQRSVTITSANDATRRNHTLPRANRTEAERAEIAKQRMSEDIAKTTDASRNLCRAWGKALETFLPGWATPQPEDRATFALVLLDAIADRSARSITRDDLEALKKVLTDEDRLRSLPFGSAAQIAGAWAVLASQQVTHEAAGHYQIEAGRWVLEGFGG